MIATSDIGPTRLEALDTSVSHIRQRNREQQLAFELLVRPAIQLVRLVGKAGTRETLLVTTAGLPQVSDTNLYDRLLIVDEAQYLAPTRKTILTRAGQGTTIVMMGDLEQIDNTYVWVDVRHREVSGEAAGGAYFAEDRGAIGVSRKFNFRPSIQVFSKKIPNKSPTCRGLGGFFS